MVQTSRGRMSNDHERFIRENFEQMSVEDIALSIGRTVGAVRDKMAIMGLKADTIQDRKLGAFADIRQSVYWKQLKEELSNEEMSLFIEHWKEIISQFKEDIHHTEKIQVMDLIKTEILMSRDLRKEKELTERLDTIKKDIDRVNRDGSLGDEERELKLELLHQNYGHNISIVQNVRQSYEKLAGTKKSLMTAIKGSREQRIKRFEDSKENIHGWLNKLINDPETRRRVGLDMEKMRLSMIVEYERLTDLHQYMDQEIDHPILNSEVVSRDELKNV